jgi:carbon monoxide dehydrogenase subunit G
MQLSGETEIVASCRRVWDAVSNPAAAVAENEGGQAQVEKVDDRHYKVTVVPAASPVPLNVTLDLELTDVQELRRIAAKISGVVMGGPIDGQGSIDLTDLAPKLTRMVWQADATLGGILAAFEPMLAGPLQSGAAQGVDSLKARLEAEEAAAG